MAHPATAMSESKQTLEAAFSGSHVDIVTFARASDEKGRRLRSPGCVARRFQRHCGGGHGDQTPPVGTRGGATQEQSSDWVVVLLIFDHRAAVSGGTKAKARRPMVRNALLSHSRNRNGGRRDGPSLGNAS